VREIESCRELRPNGPGACRRAVRFACKYRGDVSVCALNDSYK
jgi:hypothetical protein